MLPICLCMIGGAGEDRTPDPLRARQVLSQLSYDPSSSTQKRFNLGNCLLFNVGYLSAPQRSRLGFLSEPRLLGSGEFNVT